jgi:hypothetical protein
MDRRLLLFAALGLSLAGCQKAPADNSFNIAAEMNAAATDDNGAAADNTTAAADNNMAAATNAADGNSAAAAPAKP